MSEPASKPRAPQFNHVAVSLPADCLDEGNRAEILRFYGEVFGWTEMPTMTKDRERLVLKAYSFEQFVFLTAESQPTKCAPMDHFGLSVATLAELDHMLARARQYQARDRRVEIIDKQTEDHGVVKLHSFYVRHLLPFMIEVQHFEWAPGIDAEALAST
jgi:hypothetical protein